MPRIAGIIEHSELQWILTVPAIWDDKEKQFMREAALQAGIATNNLTLALEPEAASIYCLTLPVEKSRGNISLKTLNTNTQFLVVDAGGGTVDVAVQTVMENGKIKNIHVASGGDWGGTKVDEAYIQFLTDIVGQATMNEFKRSCMDDYIFLTRSFETKKRNTDPSKPEQVVFRISGSLPEIAMSCSKKTIDQLIYESCIV